MKTNKILKELRASKGVTQTEVAKIIGVTRQAYSRYESNLREPSLEILKKLADYYDVSPQIFFMEQLDSPVDHEMDIVELSALYQVKKMKTPKEEPVEETDEKPSDLTSMKSMLLTKLDISPTDLKSVKDDEEQEDDVVYVPFSPKSQKPSLFYRIKLGLFFVLIIAAIVNVAIMTIHSMDPNYEYPLLDHSYINAITPGQNVNATMYTGIVKIVPFNGTSAEIGDLVVIYSDFGINEYWVEEITGIDEATQTVSVTYDNITSKPVDFNDVMGAYENDANIFGTIYYTSKFNIGFMLLIVSHILILGAYYVGVLQKRD